MAISVESTPDEIKKGRRSLMGSSPMVSPLSDGKVWTDIGDRIDVILENRNAGERCFPPPTVCEKSECSMRMKEDSVLLMRGFDSMETTLSHLSKNLDNALQGARDLSKAPTFTEIYQSAIDKANGQKEDETRKGEGVEGRGRKRKSEETQENGKDSSEDNEAKLKKAKNLAISMGKKAALLAREVKSIRSDLSFMQERYTLLEEENRKLRCGFPKGMESEEDDLVRLQMEALMAEKSRLASENANLKRENECLQQLAEYHQLASQDLSDSYDSLILQGGICLDFSSPSPSPPPPPPLPMTMIPEEDGVDEEQTLNKTCVMEIPKFPDLHQE